MVEVWVLVVILFGSGKAATTVSFMDSNTVPQRQAERLCKEAKVTLEAAGANASCIRTQ